MAKLDPRVEKLIAEGKPFSFDGKKTISVGADKKQEQKALYDFCKVAAKSPEFKKIRKAIETAYRKLASKYAGDYGTSARALDYELGRTLDYAEFSDLPALWELTYWGLKA